MFFDLGSAFVLGLLTPLTALCVLPLYPGFLAFLANRVDEEHRHLLPFGLLTVAGVVAFMLVLGVVFSVLLDISLTAVTGVVSPIAFGLLAIIGLLLVLNVDFSRVFGSVDVPFAKSPYAHAWWFGVFFGAIVLPCNPGFIAALLAQATTVSDAVVRVLQFLAFGIGIGAPLLVLTAIPQKASRSIIKSLTDHKSLVNRASGVLLLGVAAYYLIFVFNVI